MKSCMILLPVKENNDKMYLNKAIRNGVYFVFFLIVTLGSAQDISGDWNGVLKVPSQELPIVFHVSKQNGDYITTMDSPAQGAKDLATDKTTFKNNELEIVLSKLMIVYKGFLENDTIKGTFTQGGMPIPLNLVKGKFKFKSKPQEPSKPYPYLSEEINFKNSKAGNIKFSGTLTLPKGIKKPPVAILISGSGPQDRNEELLGHKPFLILSDHLTKKGIAVLRYDDRGVAGSEGDFSKATTYDFASDVEAAVAYLKTREDVVDIKNIGLIGHSEGGMIAPLVASKNMEIAFCVLLAGPGINGKEILLTQTRKAYELVAIPESEINLNEKYMDQIYDICKNYQGEESDKQISDLFHKIKDESSGVLKAQFTNETIKNTIKQLTTPWMITFINFDPDVYLSKTTCSVLAINGEKDSQVLSKMNLNGIEKSLIKSENKDITTMELKDLNHLFQTSTTGSFSEYAIIEETFSPVALNIISDWINKRF